jgi:hypothetical protein
MKSNPVFATLIALSVAASATAFAKISDDDSTGGDARVRRALEQAELKYTVDDDGDFRLVFEEDGDRTQLVFVNSKTSTYKSMEVREVWSFGYRVDEDEIIPRARLEALLQKNSSYKVGAWGLSSNGRNVVFTIRIPADADAEMLDDAARLASETADELELDWSGDDKL